MLEEYQRVIRDDMKRVCFFGEDVDDILSFFVCFGGFKRCSDL